jgi:tetratricopeptide (TPR) repeat protein
MKHFVVLSLFLFSASVFPEKAEYSIFLLSQGKIEEASKIITRLYKENPSSAINQMTYARIITDGVEAKNIYTKVIQNSMSSDSLKAEALYQLGCFYYSQKEYILADSIFSEAKKKYTLHRILHMSALSSFNKKNYRKSQSVTVRTDNIKYTLQVGAFSTLLNAREMLLDMKKICKNVSIKKESVRGTVYHKVRVETFSTRDEARKYGEKYLRNRDIQFTVVVQ